MEVFSGGFGQRGGVLGFEAKMTEGKFRRVSSDLGQEGEGLF
jgi:hypothetical protein